MRFRMYAQAGYNPRGRRCGRSGFRRGGRVDRRVTNIIRGIMDEWIPPAIRDNRYFMYPLYRFWFKGKNLDQIMHFKANFHRLTDAEFQ